jgi:WD40 repeat protein
MAISHAVRSGDKGVFDAAGNGRVPAITGSGRVPTIKPAPDRDGKRAITAIRIEKPKSPGEIKATLLLASGSADKTVKIWDPATGRCISTLEGHSHLVYSVAWSHR